MTNEIHAEIFLLPPTWFPFNNAAFGQVEAGSIAGTVRDAAGAVIAGAQVTVKSESTGAERVTTTGSSGQYNLPGLTPGFYESNHHQWELCPFSDAN